MILRVILCKITEEMIDCMKELPKIYDPQQVEGSIYEMWQKGGYFHAKKDPDKKPFTIVMADLVMVWRTTHG